MKTLKSFFYLLVVFAIVLSACKKNVHEITDDSNLNVQVKNFEDLKVPANFDWRMKMNSTNTLKTLGNTYFPASGFSTLGFEDLWPSKGDYDFNDLVVEYQFKTATNASNNITEIKGTFIFRAVGAGAKNGFGFELDHLDTTGLVVSNSLAWSSSYVINSANGWESGQSSPTVIVVDDVTRLMPLWSNTSNGWNPLKHSSEIVTITITPRPGVDIPASSFVITENNFNPFLISDFPHSGRGREIHKVNHPPTDLADFSYFGTMDDNSSVTWNTNFYKTSRNFPWVLDIPSTVMNPTAQNSVFEYPAEKSDINWAYLHFAEWVESGGVSYGFAPTQWWIVNNSGYRNTLNIYHP